MGRRSGEGGMNTWFIHVEKHLRPKQIYLIMDFVSGGSLHHFLKKRPNRRTDDPLAKRLFFQAA